MKIVSDHIIFEDPEARLYPDVKSPFPVKEAADVAARLSLAIEVDCEVSRQKTHQMQADGTYPFRVYVPVALSARMDVRDQLVDIAVAAFSQELDER